MKRKKYSISLRSDFVSFIYLLHSVQCWFPLNLFLNRIIQKIVELSDPHDYDSSEILEDRDKKDNNNCEINCSTPLHGDTASPNIFNGVKVLKAVTPKLSAATDPFFIDMESPTKQKPVVKSGIQNLRER